MPSGGVAALTETSCEQACAAGAQVASGLDRFNGLLGRQKNREMVGRLRQSRQCGIAPLLPEFRSIRINEINFARITEPRKISVHTYRPVTVGSAHEHNIARRKQRLDI